jgi:hypothetical protein
LLQQRFPSHEATASFMRLEAACRSLLPPVHCRRRRGTRRRSTGWLFAANAACSQLTRAGQVCAAHGACPERRDAGPPRRARRWRSRCGLVRIQSPSY